MNITLTQPDDWHLHVRDGAEMASVIKFSAQQFRRAIIMPNLKPPVTTVGAALAYRDRILAALPGNASFTPLMTLYLTETTKSSELELAASCDHVHAVKYYPAGATTNAGAGVRKLANVYPLLEVMARAGLPLLIHGEDPNPGTDVFDREGIFIEHQLVPCVEHFPELKIILEHITTTGAVQYIESAPDTVAATITAHHLLLNRNAMFEQGLRPHHYCLPVLKREQHRKALLKAATSGSAKFFLGTDSAPHSATAKESACGCAGIFTAHAAMELYAEAFEQADALDKLEGFASHFGADFYGLPRNTSTISILKEPWAVPGSYVFGKDRVIPFRADKHIPWKISASKA